jgi:hypothetical protein
MLTIALGSAVLQDPSWGGSGVLPVPGGPIERVRGTRPHSVRGGHAQGEVVSVLSLRLLGLVEITQTKTSQ